MNMIELTISTTYRRNGLKRKQIRGKNDKKMIENVITECIDYGLKYFNDLQKEDDRWLAFCSENFYFTIISYTRTTQGYIFYLLLSVRSF